MRQWKFRWSCQEQETSASENNYHFAITPSPNFTHPNILIDLLVPIFILVIQNWNQYLHQQQRQTTATTATDTAIHCNNSIVYIDIQMQALRAKRLNPRYQEYVSECFKRVDDIEILRQKHEGSNKSIWTSTITSQNGVFLGGGISRHSPTLSENIRGK